MKSISIRATPVTSSACARSSPRAPAIVAKCRGVAATKKAVVVLVDTSSSSFSSSSSSSPPPPPATSTPSSARPLGASLVAKAKTRRPSAVVSASPSPQPWPAPAQAFAPSPQHYAAVAVSLLKWAGAGAAVLCAADVGRFQALIFAAGGGAATTAAGWVPWAVRALATNLVMAVGCASALQSLLETGLTPRVAAGPALVLGLLGAAVFRLVHLFTYREIYSALMLRAGAGVAGALALTTIFLLAHISSENKKRGAASPTLSSLAPARSGLPAAYALVAVLYVVLGIALQVVPGEKVAPWFAALAKKSTLPSVASPLGEALRAAVGSTLVFPASVGAWVLKDAAEKGQLSWPSSKALNLGLLLSSAARVGVVAGAVAAGDVLDPRAVWQLPLAVHSAIALVALAGLRAE